MKRKVTIELNETGDQKMSEAMRAFGFGDVAPFMVTAMTLLHALATDEARFHEMVADLKERKDANQHPSEM